MAMNVTLAGSASDGLDIRWSSHSFLLLSKPKSVIITVRGRSARARAGSFSSNLYANDDEAEEWTCMLADASAGVLRILPNVSCHSTGTPTVTVRGSSSGAQNVLSSGASKYVIDATGSASTIATSASVDVCTPLDDFSSHLDRLSLRPATATSAPTSDSPPLTFLGYARHEVEVIGARRGSRSLSPVVTIERESDHRKATVVWTLPYSPYGQPQKIQIELQKLSQQSVSGPCIVYYVDCGGTNRFELPDALESGQRYRVIVRALKVSARPSYLAPLVPARYVDSYAVVGGSTEDFRADLTKSELQRLQQMGKHSCKSSTTCLWLYRNKPPHYFAQMFNTDRGIMKVYIKDNSGDPASPINGQINGLFFMAEVEPGTHGEPYRKSAFGGTRLLVPVSVLLEMAPNLYFSDYYCMKGRSHYVTLVATKPGSETDKFCQDHLLPLSIHDSVNNPFLFQGTDGQMKVAVGPKVELLFTEDINVNHLTMFRGAKIVPNIPLIGKGSSTPGGLPKNPNCSTCNLYYTFNPNAVQFPRRGRGRGRSRSSSYHNYFDTCEFGENDFDCDTGDFGFDFTGQYDDDYSCDYDCYDW